ncbi:MAG: SCP2 sterol-binding domain-containing protein [Pseudomonadales bacterium]|jgi:putative sterol carrier protein|nr:SCP2 sterol-binding domain-containing protein [Pseudomonadales bacterium]MDP7145665.1 SCP2 sterol-binding domain-containing protein [Pseudomonadales bacterium]MDP7360801.1 SCP2 sterol-binding domain-containing protein [Pseudomonadales bacterium]MDP7594319.1 SCP2 sterol-binding domain-containing protein [Pseudomonadales bacterium]HJN51372.1 SCP2 sterol-binding domain-containing protein [Pseudomonadales bacterium]|tara:strand:+ start:964 stop:1320 length:357 start_codon:yes stop_codon:yes gene_type:complete
MSDLAGLLAELQSRLAPHFKAAFLQPAFFQFQFDEDESCYLEVATDGFEFLPGSCHRPTVTLFIDSHATLAGLLTGSIDGMEAFMQGRYRADGNIVMSQLLLHLFAPEDATVVYRVKD